WRMKTQTFSPLRDLWSVKCFRNLRSSSSKKAGTRDVISHDVQFGEGAVVHHPDLVNLYGCRIGNGTRIGTFVEIQKDVVVGDNALVGAGAVVTRDVPAYGVVTGVPARVTGDVRKNRSTMLELNETVQLAL